ncbi:hypothetical protein PABG_07075 [Paracoccidioides brasiliensis Pb03]|nr:hypothetical protein PABG_07075 [Paracoccidioides brasiliensis Pb03]
MVNHLDSGPKMVVVSESAPMASPPAPPYHKLPLVPDAAPGPARDGGRRERLLTLHAAKFAPQGEFQGTTATTKD